MDATSVTRQGQVTIPKPVRQHLGVRQGSRIEFVVGGDHAELRLQSTPSESPGSGLGLLKSRRAAGPADYEPASLLHW